jgi:hypothetical protein
VLQKYYDNPEKYSVEDGYLRRSGSWGLRMDNDSPDRVVVFLGDLGRDLPKSERDYWRSFNVAPEGSMSQTGIRRALLERVMDPCREYQLPDGGRGKRKRQSATPPKRWVASRNPSLTA